MGKRTTTFFLYILLISTVSLAQEKYVQRAMKYVEKEKFEKAKLTLDRVAINEEKSYMSDYYLVSGLIYAAQEKMDSAAICYAKVMEHKNLNSLPNKVLVDYGKELYESGKYDETIAFVDEANEELKETKYPIYLDRLKEKAFWAKENLDNYSATLGRDSIIDVSLGSNKLIIDVPRFGAAFYNDSLVFASYTEYNRPGRRDEEAFEYNQILQDYQRTNTDLYIASLDDKFESRKIFAEEIRSLENEGALTFNADYTQMYYTRNVYDRGKERFMIYHANKKGEEWIDAGPLNFNSKDFNTMQPAMSADGKGIYFVSDNPGGYGGYDIYYAEGSGKSFKKPVNLGPDINSAENEIFPYMQNDSVMIFSSNGLLGFGGYDIFWVDVKKQNQTPQNLLKPINSFSDDYCIVGNKNNPEQMLFFSDRDMSMGNLAMNLGSDASEGEALSFKISLLPPGKKLTPEELDLLLSDQASLLKDQVSNYNEKYGITPDIAESHNKLIVGPDGKTIIGSDGTPLVISDENVMLAEDGETLLDKDGNPILDINGNPVKISNGGALIAEEDGPNSKMLMGSDGKPILGSDGNPILVADGNVSVGPDGETLIGADGNPILDTDGQPVKIANAADLVGADGTFLTADIGSANQGGNGDLSTGLASLYFDLNSSQLNSEAKKNLKMVAEYLKAKPAMKLMISGNAGLRGNESYNLIISAYRAYQAYEFMTQNLGLSSANIILEANGKFFPNVTTYDVAKGLENRRVDIKAQWAKANSALKVNFKITKKHSEALIQNLMSLYLDQNEGEDSIYMVKRNEGIYRVSVANNVDIKTLKALNDLGERNFLYTGEILYTKKHSKPLSEQVFGVYVKALYYAARKESIQSISERFGVSVADIIKVNNLTGLDMVEANSKLIIPLNSDKQ